MLGSFGIFGISSNGVSIQRRTLLIHWATLVCGNDSLHCQQWNKTPIHYKHIDIKHYKIVHNGKFVFQGKLKCNHSKNAVSWRYIRMLSSSYMFTVRTIYTIISRYSLQWSDWYCLSRLLVHLYAVKFAWFLAYLKCKLVPSVIFLCSCSLKHRYITHMDNLWYQWKSTWSHYRQHLWNTNLIIHTSHFTYTFVDLLHDVIFEGNDKGVNASWHPNGRLLWQYI